MMEFAKNLRALRESNGYTQAELAARIGVHQTAVSGYETGEKMPRTDTVVRLAAVLNVSIDELLGGKAG